MVLSFFVSSSKDLGPTSTGIKSPFLLRNAVLNLQAVGSFTYHFQHAVENTQNGHFHAGTITRKWR